MKTSYILGKNIRDAVLSAKHSVTESLRNVKESAQDLVAGLKGQAPSSEEVKIQETEFTDLRCENPEFAELNERTKAGTRMPSFDEYRKSILKNKKTKILLGFVVMTIVYLILFSIYPVLGYIYIGIYIGLQITNCITYLTPLY